MPWLVNSVFLVLTATDTYLAVNLGLKPGFQFFTVMFVPTNWLTPSREDIRRDSSCLSALPALCLPEPDTIVSLGTVQICQQGTEASHAPAIY